MLEQNGQYSYRELWNGIEAEGIRAIKDPFRIRTPMETARLPFCQDSVPRVTSDAVETRRKIRVNDYHFYPVHENSFSSALRKYVSLRK